jgi:hypothetical protein
MMSCSDLDSMLFLEIYLSSIIYLSFYLYLLPDLDSTYLQTPGLTRLTRLI